MTERTIVRSHISFFECLSVEYVNLPVFLWSSCPSGQFYSQDRSSAKCEFLVNSNPAAGHKSDHSHIPTTLLIVIIKPLTYYYYTHIYNKRYIIGP